MGPLSGLDHRQRQLLVVFAVLAALGAVSLFISFWTARGASTNKDWSGPWAGLGSGLLTGAIVSVGLLIFQIQLTRDSEEPTWRANVQAADSIPGFSIPTFLSHKGYRPINNINFSGKDLHDANLNGVHLEGVEMRDTNLRGATLVGTHLEGADLVAANLEGADLKGAYLTNARLQGANFRTADIEHAASFAGAVASDKTCWTQAFLVSPDTKSLSEGIVANPGQTKVAPQFQRGRMDPNCLPRPAPGS